MMNNIEKGLYGENLASKHLISKGYKIIDRNYRTKIGEIDIIAIKSRVIVFVEVKTRSSTKYGFPYEAVNKKKQDRIIKSSFVYIKQNNIRDYQIRYDIIEVYLHEDSKINHIENVFCF